MPTEHISISHTHCHVSLLITSAQGCGQGFLSTDGTFHCVHQRINNCTPDMIGLPDKMDIENSYRVCLANKVASERIVDVRLSLQVQMLPKDPVHTRINT